jgi:hypothetical protein
MLMTIAKRFVFDSGDFAPLSKSMCLTFPGIFDTGVEFPFG